MPRHISEVFLLVPSMTSAGPIKGAIALANGLAESVNTTLVALKPGGELTDAYSSKVSFISLAAEGSLASRILSYRRLVPRNAASISFCFSADMANLFVKKGVATVSSVRGTLSRNYRLEFGPRWGALLAKIHLIAASKGLNYVVAMTKDMARDIKKEGGADACIIGNFVDEKALDDFRNITANIVGPLRFVYVGRLSAIKNPSIVLYALAMIKEKGHDLRMDFLGDGPLRTRLEQEAKSLGLADDVIFHGHVEAPFSFIRLAHAMVLPSLSEGISRAAMEALYLGTPCVMRNVDGNQELIKDGWNGYLFKDDASLAEAMIKASELGRSNVEDNLILLPDSFRQAQAVAAYLELLQGRGATGQADYFEYLQTRSRLGELYRKFWLYPRLARNLKGRAIDIGCGIGDFLRFRQNTIGTDINPKTVEWCKNKGQEAHLIEHGRLPFAKAYFDSAIMDNVLEHIEDPTPLLSEVRRVLKPGSPFVVGVPGARGFDSDPDHKVYYDEDKLIETLAKAGFDILKRFYMPLPGKWLDATVRQHCLYSVFQARS